MAERKNLKEFTSEKISTYPHLTKKSMNILVPFTITYLCETEFLVLASTNSKRRNRLYVSDDMRVALSVTEPWFDHLIS